MSGRWDQTKVLKLIQLYQENECLWNTKSVFYKKETARDNAYKRMIQGMGDPFMTKKVLQQKIQNLRSIYFQELIKVKEKAGAYKPKLVWYDELNFLANNIEEKDAVSTELTWPTSPSNTRNDTPPTEEFVSVNVDCNEMYIKEESIDADEEEIVEKSLDPQEEEEIMNVPNIPEDEYVEPLDDDGVPPKRKRCETGVFVMPQTTVVAAADNINNTTNNGDDEFYYFGMSIAAQLRNMPLELTLQIQAKIQSFLANVRCQMLKDSTQIRNFNFNTISDENDLSFEKKTDKKHITIADLKSPNRQIICTLHTITENQLRMQTQLSSIQSSLDKPRESPSDKIIRQNLVIAKETYATVKKLIGERYSISQEELGTFFPIANLSDVEKLEQEIQDQASEDALKAYLSHKKGLQSLDLVLRNLATDEFLDGYNWDGRWGKRSLRSIRLFGVILSDVFCQLNKKEFETEIRKAIELSHNRAKQKRIKSIFNKPNP